MSILEKIGSIIQEIGYDYEIDGNAIMVKGTPVSFQDENTCIQICGGICPITPNLAPDINRVNRYFERRNAAFQCGRWVMYNGNNRVLVEQLPTIGFNSFSKDEAEGVFKMLIMEYTNENRAVLGDLMAGNI